MRLPTIAPAAAFALTLAVTSLASSPARADDPQLSATGFSLGLHAGYSVPIGLARDTALSNVVSGAIPIGVDAGYFITPHLYVGGSFTYGFAFFSQSANNTCDTTDDPDITCSANLLRFEAIVRWHFRPYEHVDPWVGAGLGYDIVNLVATDQADGSTDQSGALHGFELLNLQGGFDYKPRDFYGFGPYVELATGHYVSDTSAISLHTWLTFGVRLRTGL